MEMGWFSHHPASMLVAFVALGGNAVLIKKRDGYENTETHGGIMNAAMLLAIFGECCNRSVQISADVYCDNSSNAQVGMSSTATKKPTAGHT